VYRKHGLHAQRISNAIPFVTCAADNGGRYRNLYYKTHCRCINLISFRELRSFICRRSVLRDSCY
jgi:hypothetical protein